MYVRMRNHPGVRIIYTPHAWSFLKTDVTTPAKWGYGLVERVLARRCDQILCMSFDELRAARRYRIPAEKIRAYLYRHRLRRSCLCCETKKDETHPIKVGYFGRLDYQKGFDVVLVRRCRYLMQVLSFMHSAQRCAGESTQESRAQAMTPGSRITAGSAPPVSGTQCTRWMWSWCLHAGKGLRSSRLKPCGRARSLLYPEKASLPEQVIHGLPTASSSAN